MGNIERELRSAEHSFLSDEATLEYEAQDFWVHLFTRTAGSRRAYPLGELAGVLSQGFHTTQVAAALLASDGKFEDLGTEYWAWAKNQVYEKTDVTFEGALKGKCRIAPKRLGDPHALVYPRDFADQPPEGTFDAPLQTKWAAIKFREEVNAVRIRRGRFARPQG